MKMLKNLAARGALAASLLVGSAASQADVIDLGFLLDGSGSVGPTNWTTMTSGLAAALSLIPTTGPNTYRISVVKFASSATTVVPATTLTAANLVSIQNTIATSTFTGGLTNIDAAISEVSANFTSVGFGNSSLINISSDGAPNQGNTNAQQLQDEAVVAGWDSISAEAIGNFNQTFLNTLVYPQPAFVTSDPNSLPNPLDQGFVLAIADFGDYEGAIAAKVQKIVEVPEPGTLALMSIAAFGLAGIGRRRRA